MKQMLQANIKGFYGKPVSLFGVIDTDTGVLNIVKLAQNQIKRKDGCILISNEEKNDYDFAFNDGLIRKAIISYYDLKSGFAEDGITPLLMIGNKVGSSDPQSSIEQRGISESGTEYQISAGITNQQMAALGMCLYARQSTSIRDCFEMFNEIDDILNGGYLAI